MFFCYAFGMLFGTRMLFDMLFGMFNTAGGDGKHGKKQKKTCHREEKYGYDCLEKVFWLIFIWSYWLCLWCVCRLRDFSTCS